MSRAPGLWMRVHTTPIRIELSKNKRAELEARKRSLTMAYRDVQRATIVQLLAEGQSVSAIARRASSSAPR